MQTIFRQEVLQNETRNTTRRQALGVRRMKYKDYLTQNKMDKEKKRKYKKFEESNINQSQQDINLLQNQQNQSVKKRKTLLYEKEVLKRLLIYKTKIPD